MGDCYSMWESLDTETLHIMEAPPPLTTTEADMVASVVVSGPELVRKYMSF